MAKSLAGGFPLSAVTGKAEIMDAPAAGGLGGTYGGSPIGCAAANAVLDVMEEEKLLERANVIGKRMIERLTEMKRRNSFGNRIGDIRGLGAMVACELITKDGTPDADLTKQVVNKAGENGLILLSCGVNANVLRFLMPLTAPDAIIEEGFDILEKTIGQVLEASGQSRVTAFTAETEKGRGAIRGLFLCEKTSNALRSEFERFCLVLNRFPASQMSLCILGKCSSYAAGSWRKPTSEGRKSKGVANARRGRWTMLATKILWVERMVGAAIIAHRCRRKIQGLAKKLPIERQAPMRDGVRRRFPGYSNDLWHRAYAAVNGHASVDYVPEDLFYNVFETRLNPRNRREPYKDKNFFDRMGWDCLPDTIFRIINGRLFDKTYEMIDMETALALAREAQERELVVKPAIDSAAAHR